MDSKLFREKSIEQITAPEQLKDIIKVVNPGIWMILGAIVILLAGFCVWIGFGEFTAYFDCRGFVQDNILTLYISGDDYSALADDYELQIDDEDVSFVQNDIERFSSPSELSDYEQNITDFEENETVYALKGVCSLKDGVYDVTVIINRVSAISLLTD